MNQNSSDPRSRFIGVDIGGTKIAVTMGNERGEVEEKIKFPTDRNPDTVIASITETIHHLADRIPAGAARSIGISCGGPLDSAAGLIQSPPNLPGWDNIPVVSLLTAETGIPCYLENDANACALAEWYWGAGRGFRNVLFLTFGTGLGCGLVLDGNLYRGTSGMAGEIGHIRLAADGPVGFGKAGSWEGFCSGGGLSRAYSGRFGETRTARDICAYAVADDSRARSIIDESARQLGYGLSILIDTLNPERIVIGSIFTRNEALFRPIMDEVIRLESLEQSRNVCRVVPSELGEELGDRAALGVAIHGYED